MNLVTDWQTEVKERNATSKEWRERIQRAINVEVMTAAEEQFLVQVTDEWFVWVTKPRRGDKTYNWIQLRAKVDLSTFLRFTN